MLERGLGLTTTQLRLLGLMMHGGSMKIVSGQLYHTVKSLERKRLAARDSSALDAWKATEVGETLYRVWAKVNAARGGAA
jgi:hypothetical protein